MFVCNQLEILGENTAYYYNCFGVFLVIDFLSVLRGYSFFSIPATTANDIRLRRISIPDLIHYIIFLS